MTKDEALNRANALRDKIFTSYNLIQFIDETQGGSVKLPREGDWVGWIARAILDAANEIPEQSIPTIDMEELARKVKSGEIKCEPLAINTADFRIDYSFGKK